MYLSLLLASGVLCLALGYNSRHKFWGIILCSTAAVGFSRPALGFSVESLLTNAIFLLLHLVLLVLSPLQIIWMWSAVPVADDDGECVDGIVDQYLPGVSSDGKEDIIVE